MDRRPRSVDSYYVKTEQATFPAGLFTDPDVWAEGKAFMAYIGRHLRGSSYRAVGLPDQRYIAEEHLGWSVSKLEEVVRHLKFRGWLKTEKCGFKPGSGVEFAYLIRAPQMGLNLVQASKPEPQTGKVPKPQTGKVPYNYSLLSSNPVVFRTTTRDGRTIRRRRI